MCGGGAEAAQREQPASREEDPQPWTWGGRGKRNVETIEKRDSKRKQTIQKNNKHELKLHMLLGNKFKG